METRVAQDMKRGAGVWWGEGGSEGGREGGRKG